MALPTSATEAAQVIIINSTDACGNKYIEFTPSTIDAGNNDTLFTMNPLLDL